MGSLPALATANSRESDVEDDSSAQEDPIEVIATQIYGPPSPGPTYGRVYFVSVDYNSITGLTTKTCSQKFSICAAVAAVAGPSGRQGSGWWLEGPRRGGDGRTN